MSKEAAYGVTYRLIGEVAAQHAAEVDRDARFPSEAVATLRQSRLLSALVPRELGGMEMPVGELAAICTILGQHCAAAAMVFAMHQIQAACIVRHALVSPLFRRYCRELVERQMLIASVTSEVGGGGDTRSSLCAVETQDGGFRLDKNAPTISYGAHADDLLVTCRRAADAPASDQVLVLVRGGQYRLEQTTQWDTLGMRGTCSPGFSLHCAGPLQQILPVGFAEISCQTMVPYSHLLWSALWLGIATDAVARAAAFVRVEARRCPGIMPPTAQRLAELSSLLQLMRCSVHDTAGDYDRLQGSAEGREVLMSLGFALRMNQLKTSCSALLAQIVHQALLICGILGYKNDSEFSLGRQLRDAHSAELMVGNDRIHAKSASMLLVHKDD